MMKKTAILLLLFVGIYSSALAQFGDYFLPKTLRLDYYHCGDASSEHVFFKELIEEPHWAGNPDSCIDEKDLGNQKLLVYDAATNKLIYSQGYCTLFTEWQTTQEAQTTQKSYAESVVMPFPKSPIKVVINSRDKENNWVQIFEYQVDPSSYWIRQSNPSLESFDVVYSGAAAKKVDIVILAEGYTEQNRDKFYADCEVFAKEFFSYEPYKSRRKEFNIRGVWSPSKESGASMPGENIWKETALGSQYYTFDSERYIMIDDLQRVRDIAANVPYDVIYVLANTKKYGGGGIYNFYGISAAGDPSFAGKVYVHEFGHLFVGLADEYVGADNYDSPFYRPGVEPWEENLTTLADFDKKPWKSMLDEGTPIPTEECEGNKDKLGVYEGGGYLKDGVYRPWMDCLMRTLNPDAFCPVCTKALSDRIDALTK